MLSFYELLQKIKQRPALYLGKRSISHLQVFLDGYTFAQRQLGVPLSEQEQEFEEFQDWIEKRFNQQSTQSWTRIILFYSEDERDALEQFFQLFEEFLSRDKYLETNETDNLKSIMSISNGERVNRAALDLARDSLHPYSDYKG